MAGRPQRRTLIAELERRTRETVPDDPEATHLDYVVYWTEGGGTIVKLGLEIGVDPQQISRYLRRTFPDSESRLAEARVEGARRMAEDSIQVVDDAEPDKESQGKARNQASVRQWLAERWNRGEFGQQRGAAVQINLNVLHLDALRQRAVSGAETARTRAFNQERAEKSALAASSDAIAGAIAASVEDVSYEVIES